MIRTRVSFQERALVAAMAAALAAMGCAASRFDRYLSEQRWTDAADAFAADSSLMNNERALFRAAALMSSPERSTYAPDRAHELFSELLSRFPRTRYRVGALDRLALLDAVSSARDDVSRVREDATARQREIEARISSLTAESSELRMRLQSEEAQNAEWRNNAARLEAALRDRDEQIRVLRLELLRLKEIDLKQRVPGTTSESNPH